MNNPLPLPDLLLAKTATSTTFGAVGDEITYDYLVTNNSTTSTLAGPVTVTDDKATVDCPAGDLAPLASITCTATYASPRTISTRAAVTNTATAEAGGIDSNQDQVVVDAIQAGAPDTGQGSAAGRRGPDDRPSAGDVIRYTLTATNDGNVDADGTSRSPIRRCRHWSATQPVDLAPGEKLTCTGTRTLTQADIDDGQRRRTPRRSRAPTRTTTRSTDRADEDVPLGQEPHLTLEKTGGAGGGRGRPARRGRRRSGTR